LFISAPNFFARDLWHEKHFSAFWISAVNANSMGKPSKPSSCFLSLKFFCGCYGVTLLSKGNVEGIKLLDWFCVTDMELLAVELDILELPSLNYPNTSSLCEDEIFWSSFLGLISSRLPLAWRRKPPRKPVAELINLAALFCGSLVSLSSTGDFFCDSRVVICSSREGSFWV